MSTELIMYLLPHYMALIWTKEIKIIEKKNNLFLKVLKSGIREGKRPVSKQYDF